jgi:hypothetical protein
MGEKGNFLIHPCIKKDSVPIIKIPRLDRKSFEREL